MSPSEQIPKSPSHHAATSSRGFVWRQALASSSSSARKQLNKNQTEEELVGLKGDSSENLPNSDEEGNNKRAYEPKVQGTMGTAHPQTKALVNYGDGKQNETVIEKVSSEEVGDRSCHTTLLLTKSCLLYLLCFSNPFKLY
ncbi:hypothetical protein OIU77_020783 [Salix suchowensis]|uniref:Uncharacterized protein n=1 Tax=Salix suchowensis TaxID=1278906 RepID=A0ABQ9C8F1_9ROSI|nr:hypothetical protein OIU77_020783 [Salix suchowensis]